MLIGRTVPSPPRVEAAVSARSHRSNQRVMGGERMTAESYLGSVLMPRRADVASAGTR